MLPRRRRDLVVAGTATLAFGGALLLAWLAIGEASAILGLAAIFGLVVGMQIESRRKLAANARAQRRLIRRQLNRELRRHGRALRRQRDLIRRRTQREPRRFHTRQARDTQLRIDETYRQVEALFSLFASLEIREPLPAMRSMAISPDFANLLVAEVRRHRPDLIVELGSGVSTLVTAYCLRQLGRGRIIALEHERGFAEHTTATVERHGLADLVSVRHAPLTEVSLRGGTWSWYDPAAIEDCGVIDLLIVDGPPAFVEGASRYPALPVLLPRLATDAVVFVDDYVRDEERDMVARWRHEHPDFSVEEIPLEKGLAVLRRAGGATDTNRS
jgi:predicted O-methyltransferase YrrM